MAWNLFPKTESMPHFVRDGVPLISKECVAASQTPKVALLHEGKGSIARLGGSTTPHTVGLSIFISSQIIRCPRYLAASSNYPNSTPSRFPRNSRETPGRGLVVWTTRLLLHENGGLIPKVILCTVIARSNGNRSRCREKCPT